MIIGFDVQYRNIGWGIVKADGDLIEYVDSGSIRTPSDMSLERTLSGVRTEVMEILWRYQPSQMVMRDLTGRTCEYLSTGRGIAFTMAVLHEVAGKHKMDAPILVNPTAEILTDIEVVSELDLLTIEDDDFNCQNQRLTALALAMTVAREQLTEVNS